MICVSRDAMRLLHDGSRVLTEIEHHGVRVNVDYLKSTTENTESQIRELEARMKQDDVYKLWRKTYGDATRLSSKDQLADVLFNRMGFEVRGHTAKGRIKVDKDALDDIDHPFVEDHLKLDGLRVVRNNFLYAIRKEMVKDGSFWYIHPNFNLHTAATFRSSCDGPNLQNFPKRNYELAQLIRPCFMPHPGQVMVEIDFGQIEVRVAACYTKDPNLIRYVSDPATDMHRDTAMELFCLTKKNFKENGKYYKKTCRDSAKNQWVFPQFYGSVYFNCVKNIWKAMRARDFRVSEEGKSLFDHLNDKGIQARGACIPNEEPTAGTFEAHCKKIEHDFWNRRFRVYTAWKREWYEAYRRNGGFRMLTGFAVNGLFSRNGVTNYPIQGSAFHCLLWCLVELGKWLRANGMKSKIIGEIHDSALLSVEPSELQDVLTKMHSLMTVELPKAWSWITVPLEAEADVSPEDGHWMECKPWINQNGTWCAAV